LLKRATKQRRRRMQLDGKPRKKANENRRRCEKGGRNRVGCPTVGGKGQKCRKVGLPSKVESLKRSGGEKR